MTAFSTLFPACVYRIYEHHCAFLQRLEERLCNWRWQGVLGDVVSRFFDITSVRHAFIREIPLKNMHPIGTRNLFSQVEWGMQDSPKYLILFLITVLKLGLSSLLTISFYRYCCKISIHRFFSFVYQYYEYIYVYLKLTTGLVTHPENTQKIKYIIIQSVQLCNQREIAKHNIISNAVLC